jgi:hypothetical protein
VFTCVFNYCYHNFARLNPRFSKLEKLRIKTMSYSLYSKLRHIRITFYGYKFNHLAAGQLLKQSKSYSTPAFPAAIVSGKRLTKLERAEFNVRADLRDILIGLLLGDLFAQKRSLNGNTKFHFEQGYVNKDYIHHLYDLFKDYCNSGPKIGERLPDKRTGKIYTRVYFVTYSLPCFNEFHKMFYPKGKKIVPLNIEELLTPLGLAY